MKAVIIDDERPARSEMRRLLRAHPQVVIVGEASNSEEALPLIRELSPDLLFLDVQLQGNTGFDLLARLTRPPPRVIFTTAYDEYAVRAFEINALDYLLKPVAAARLQEALLRTAETPGAETWSPVREPKFAESDRVFIREEDRCWFLPLREICLLVSEGNYTRIFFRDARPVLYRSLNALEARLPDSLFFRANRSQILNLTYIESVEHWFSGGLKLRLRGGMEVEVSRRQSMAFRGRTAL